MMDCKSCSLVHLESRGYNQVLEQSIKSQFQRWLHRRQFSIIVQAEFVCP